MLRYGCSVEKLKDNIADSIADFITIVIMLVFLLLAILKIFGIISISWWLITFPLWFGVAVGLAYVVGLVAIVSLLSTVVLIENVVHYIKKKL